MKIFLFVVLFIILLFVYCSLKISSDISKRDKEIYMEHKN